MLPHSQSEPSIKQSHPRHAAGALCVSRHQSALPGVHVRRRCADLKNAVVVRLEDEGDAEKIWDDCVWRAEKAPPNKRQKSGAAGEETASAAASAASAAATAAATAAREASDVREMIVRARLDCNEREVRVRSRESLAEARQETLRQARAQVNAQHIQLRIRLAQVSTREAAVVRSLLTVTLATLACGSAARAIELSTTGLGHGLCKPSVPCRPSGRRAQGSATPPCCSAKRPRCSAKRPHCSAFTIARFSLSSGRPSPLEP